MTASPSEQIGTSPVLITLVGDEPLAPLVLARHLGARRIICIGQPMTDWRVEPLLGILRRDGCTTDWISVTVHDVPAGLAEIEPRLPLGGQDELVFDLTNARGLLGIVMYELAHRCERKAPERCRLVRIDWSDRLVRAISPDSAESQQLHAEIRLPDYLEVHGKRLMGFERGPGSKSGFGMAAQRIARSIPQARALMAAAHHGSPDRPLRMHGQRPSSGLIEALIEDGVLVRHGSALFPSSMEAFQFIHGRWLEEYLFEVADASGKFDDCASGVRFSWWMNGEANAAIDVANEIDFAGTVDGRATIASCKTGGRDVNGPLYELLTLAERAAGRSVVTVFATTEVLDRPARRRAAALGVRILDATRLPDPEYVLTSLLNGPSAPAPPSGPRSRPEAGSGAPPTPSEPTRRRTGSLRNRPRRRH